MSAWWPMEAPPLPGPDALRLTCPHGWVPRDCPTCGAPGPEAGPSERLLAAGRAISVGFTHGLELGGRSVLEHLGSYNGTADVDGPIREAQPWIYRGTGA